jgi:hypothetical protein
MLIVGVILFLAAAIFGLDVVDKNRFRIRAIRAFGDNLGVSGAAHLYIVGAITGAALVIAIMLILAGLRRKGSKARTRRRERKAADKQEGELSRLRAQNERLAQRNDDRRGPGSGATVEAPGPPVS